jgi:hypothetical protein
MVGRFIRLATVLALAPALGAHWCGACFRQVVFHERFRRTVLLFLLIGGLDIVRRGLS